MANSLSSLARDRVTTTVGAAYVLLGATNASLGAVSDELRRSLGLSAAVTGLHGAMFGWFLLACGLASAPLRRAAEPARLVRAGIVAVGAGLMVLAAGHHAAVTLGGAALIGAGGAVLVLGVPEVIGAHHGGTASAAAFTWINALSQLGSVAAPLAMAVALRHGTAWRWLLAALGALGGGAALVRAVRTRLPGSPTGDAAAGSAPATSLAGLLRRLRHDGSTRRRWLVVVLGVAVEFATLFWAAAALQRLGGTSASTGAVAVGLFAAGMVVGRLAGPRVVTAVADTTVLRASFAAAAAGALLLRLGPGVTLRLAGVALCGLGIALVYPVAFSRLYAGGAPERQVSALGALASGLAITVAPPVLGALADGFGLGPALLVVPAFALAGLVATA